MFIYTAFMVGLVGGMHCIGMCGPITMALPLYQKSLVSKITAGLLYHVGRVITYSLLGLLFALLGKGINMAGFQQVVSIVLGVLMILSAGGFFINLRFTHKISHRIGTSINKRLKPLLGTKNTLSFAAIGFLNGFLPCGLVYVAIAGSLVADSLMEGILYMTFFGIGTIPLLAAFMFFSHSIGARFKKAFQKIIPIFVFLLGVLFVLRGLNLGIRYISPKIDKKEQVVKSCCEPKETDSNQVSCH
jgi:sulfite exporter TauE/SafE